MPYKKKKDYQDYMKEYMKEYRKRQRELIQRARQNLGLTTKIRTQRKRKRRK